MPKPLGTLILWPANKGNRHAFAKDGGYPDDSGGLMAWLRDNPSLVLFVAVTKHIGYLVATHTEIRARYHTQRLSRRIRHTAYLELQERKAAIQNKADK